MRIEVVATHEVEPGAVAVIASEFLEWLEIKGLRIESGNSDSRYADMDFRELGDEFAKATAGGVIKRG